VDVSKSVINYRRTDASATSDLSRLDKLRRLQCGLIAIRGGDHMALMINGSVYEVHLGRPATDPTTIEATPLETFGWLSGVVAAPKGDIQRAWDTP
jgi:hypothetical protein